jgi:hypothetical protein
MIKHMGSMQEEEFEEGREKINSGLNWLVAWLSERRVKTRLRLRVSPRPPYPPDPRMG